ncbi:MAG TPA: shikimate dehydrogenase [bacterium]|jgi:shikimate dehydrogenase|nr:shikimate dehydrogenase [bacterium]
MKSTQANITGASQVVFILGHPVSHSLSPAMHNAAFEKVRLPWLYTPLDISPREVGPVVKMMRAFNARGANVTVPYKEKVIAYLDFVEPEAKWLGSVNTIYRKGNQLCGTSTDGEGFLRSLGSWRSKLKDTRGLLIGAGGAAKAVAGALAKSGVKGFYIANRSGAKAARLMKSLRQKHPKLDIQAIPLKDAGQFVPYSDWIVQSTSLGLKGEASPVALKEARQGTLIVDLIYHRETDFLKQAKRLGLPHLGGLGMLLHQGALSFERWTGLKAPVDVMHKALVKGLKAR